VVCEQTESGKGGRVEANYGWGRTKVVDFRYLVWAVVLKLVVLKLVVFDLLMLGQLIVARS